jgi:hypothetical protein
MNELLYLCIYDTRKKTFKENCGQEKETKVLSKLRTRKTKATLIEFVFIFGGTKEKIKRGLSPNNNLRQDSFLTSSERTIIFNKKPRSRVVNV